MAKVRAARPTVATHAGHSRVCAGRLQFLSGCGFQNASIQILTIDDILTFKKTPRLPVVDSSAFRKAKREEKTDQGKFDL